ncbi:MAG TPA: STAS domain-containing protein [Acidimicrobiia bacterium]|nr:STAS domain-containing protein [Acidimicrobiia bacterium]
MGRSKWAAIKLDGEIDIARVHELTEVLAREWLPTQNLLIDLCAVRFMDSAGIRWLFATHKQIADAGRDVRLIIAEGGPVERLLSIAGVDQHFTIYRNLDKALEKIATRSLGNWLGRLRI